MKASPRQQSLLLELQDLDNSLARLRRKKQQLLERNAIASMASEATEAKTAFMSVQREIDSQKAEIERFESDVELVQQRITRDEQLLSSSTSAKEAQSLGQELEALKKRKSDLEDRELELMQTYETTQARFDEAAAQLSQLDLKKQSLQEQLLQGEREIDLELAAKLEERAGLSAELQRDLLDHYEKLRSRNGIAVARLRGNISEASNMELAPAVLSEIRKTAADELVYCPQSGAILVRTGD